MGIAIVAFGAAILVGYPLYLWYKSTLPMPPMFEGDGDDE